MDHPFYTDDELNEFSIVMESYAVRTKRTPSYPEILAIFKSLGWRKVPSVEALPIGAS